MKTGTIVAAALIGGLALLSFSKKGTDEPIVPSPTNLGGSDFSGLSSIFGGLSDQLSALLGNQQALGTAIGQASLQKTFEGLNPVTAVQNRINGATAGFGGFDLSGFKFGLPTGAELPGQARTLGQNFGSSIGIGAGSFISGGTKGFFQEFASEPANLALAGAGSGAAVGLLGGPFGAVLGGIAGFISGGSVAILNQQHANSVNAGLQGGLSSFQVQSTIQGHVSDTPAITSLRQGVATRYGMAPQAQPRPTLAPSSGTAPVNSGGRGPRLDANGNIPVALFPEKYNVITPKRTAMA